MSCNVPISIGELWDKYTILLIKKNNIMDLEKLKHVDYEINQLKSLISLFPISTDLEQELFNCNNKLWIIEDKIREKEYNKLFNHEFIDLARSVYITNDERASIKKNISLLHNSNIIEVKSYADYK
jgi:hypothetical protein